MMYRYVIALIFFFVFISLSAALPTPTDDYVNDFAHILPDEDVTFLRTIFSYLEENTTAEVVFVSVENAEGYDASEYATMIGQEWGVGKEDVDNGVVILYVADVGRLWVATGYGAEGILPDSKIGRMLDETYVPFRDEGNVSEGIVQFSIVLAEEMEANSGELISGRKRGISPWIFILIVFVVIIILVIVLSQFSKKHSRAWWTPILIPSGSSGGGFGGGSFGGGGFGGGGAGR